MSSGSIGLAFIAGLLSILSPCVLPLLPIVLGAAAAEHRRGPLALAAGVAVAFLAIGLFVATLGFAIGLDGDVFRIAAAIMMMLVGAILVVPPLQVRLAAAGGPISDWTERRFGGLSAGGLGGQFGVGVLLGAVWSPCVGPTLGAASIAAARGEDLPSVALTMAVFGLGAALPLLLLGLASRQALLRWRDRLRQGSGLLKRVLGGALVVAGLLILTGADKQVEAGLVDASPAWLTILTTRF